MRTGQKLVLTKTTLEEHFHFFLLWMCCCVCHSARTPLNGWLPDTILMVQCLVGVDADQPVSLRSHRLEVPSRDRGCLLLGVKRTLLLASNNHGALTICLHAGGKPASVSGGLGLGGGGCNGDSWNQKSSS